MAAAVASGVALVDESENQVMMGQWNRWVKLTQIQSHVMHSHFHCNINHETVNILGQTKCIFL